VIDLYRTWYEVLASTDHRWAILTGHDVSSNFYYEYPLLKRLLGRTHINKILFLFEI
jgi:hypothetical protein